MADLPPLSRLPESGISPELVGQLEHSANWASTFGGSGTNIALRHRHNQDIEQYAGVLQQQREAAQAQMLQQSKAAQSLVFGVQRLDMEERQAKARLRHEEELHPLKLKAQEAKIQADLARERATVKAADFKNKATLQEEDDTDAFHDALNKGLSQNIKIGTPQWAELVAVARLDAPAMKSEIFDDVWKATSRSALTPQEAIDQAVKKKEALMAVTPPKAAAKEKPDSYEEFNKDLEQAKKAYTTGPLPPFIQKAFEDRGKRLEEQTQGTAAPPAPGQPAAPAASPTAPAKIAVASANQAALDWLAANPADPRAAAVKAKLGIK